LNRRARTFGFGRFIPSGEFQAEKIRAEKIRAGIQA
jgi:hypothetical protein